MRKAHYENGIFVNPISFQVGTLEEVVNAHEYFEQRQIYISRLGRDFPGSNWALYVLDPDGHRIEFYYGMEQIGWDRRSKPAAAYIQAVRNGFSLPQPAEMTEIMHAEQAASISIADFARPRACPTIIASAASCCSGRSRSPRSARSTCSSPISLHRNFSTPSCSA